MEDRRDRLTGSVERVTYYNPENGYTVIRLRPDRARLPAANREGLVTVVGNLPELSPGEHLKLLGRWGNHPKHGAQFICEVCEQSLPATIAGIRKYMGSGLIKGIGPRLAERIVAQFGLQTLDVIENHPERLKEVPDIGPKRSRAIARAWAEQKQVKEIMLFLHGHGVSTNLAVKIYKTYGDEALNVVQTDPYRLARDIFGVGFKTADKIAQALGLPLDHPSRIEAGVVYALNESSDDGHVYLPFTDLVARAAELLSLDPALISPAIERLEQEDRVTQDLLHLDSLAQEQAGPSFQAEAAGLEDEGGGRSRERGRQVYSSPSNSLLGVQAVGESPAFYGRPVVYLTPLYRSETGVAGRLSSLASTLPSRLSDLPPAFVPLDPMLSAEQRSAIGTALSHPVSILTGGPGTGKTTCLKALITVLESARKTFALASPTGRAAKRLSQATDRPASTIHRLLGYKPGEGFEHNADHPIDVDLLVVDEASMLDLTLANHLLKAIQPGTHLLLVGDVDQLPSVGAGDVLRDIIASGQFPVTRLSVIFRQAAHSQIITNAHRINQGKQPRFASRDSTPDTLQDFFLFPAETPEEAAKWVLDVVCNRIPQKFGFHPRDDVQVLAPMYRGPAGVTALNESLQAALNPPALMKPEKLLYGQIFRPGDKVMQTQNNYDKDTYNGDIGTVRSIDFEQQNLTLDFDGRIVVYDWSEADQLVLAYAVSVHKSQGSEFPAVVIPILTSHYLMLQRNLIYTAITRAKKLCVLVGSRRAIGIAVHNDKVAHRHTALDFRLRHK